MLIEFRLRTFVRSEIPRCSRWSEHAKANTFDSGLNGFGPFVRSAAVYGSNAAGKTNLLRAIQFMQEMVVTSAARPSGARATPYSPYKFSPKTRNSPSDFQITFPENNVRYEYGFSLSAERVEREWLIEYVTSKGRTLFQRDYDNRAKKYKWSFSSFFKGQRLLWSESTRPDSLFLSTVIS